MPFSRATKDDVRRTLLLELMKRGIPATSDQGRMLLGSATFQACLDAALDQLDATLDRLDAVTPVVPVQKECEPAYELYRTYAVAAGAAYLIPQGFRSNEILVRGWRAVAAYVAGLPDSEPVRAHALNREFRAAAGVAPQRFCDLPRRSQDGFYAAARRAGELRLARTPGEAYRDRWAAAHGLVGALCPWADLRPDVQEAWELQAAEAEKARAAEAAEHFRFV